MECKMAHTSPLLDLIEIKYNSVGCNSCTTNAIDWGTNGVVCFASSNAVMLWNPNWTINGIPTSLNKHTDRVNAVRWIKTLDTQGTETPETDIISASNDGTAIYWQLNSNDSSSQTIDVTKATGQTLTGHTSAVNQIDGLSFDGNLILATASVDYTVKLWKKPHETVELFQTVPFTNGVCVSLKLFHHKTTVLACTTASNRVNLYFETSNEFELIHTLQGHEGWIRDLDFVRVDPHNVLLATCSQDSLIRVWKLSFVVDAGHGDDIKPIEEQFIVDGHKCAVTTECVIAAHDNWVYGVHWKFDAGLKLVSCSTDKTVAIFHVDGNTCEWTECARFGDVGDQQPGFFGVKFSPDAKRVLAYDYNGAFHVWSFDEDTWHQIPTIGGHQKEVTDIDWDRGGSYLISTSRDQTTRIHAPYDNNWFELARSQIHGYDMFCVASLNPEMYASGAEEKVARVFHAPRIFWENYRATTKLISSVFVESATGIVPVPLLLAECSFGGSEDPPTEEYLRQNTLWPETQKLYAHGLEIYAMAACANYLATSSKATKPNDAYIIVWDTKTWTQLSKLYSHTLTITQMEFSPDATMLLSVSRDRRWSVFKKRAESFELLASSTKENGVHTRIIWGCAWSANSKYFATVSRDGKVVMWRVDGERVESKGTFEWKNESVTSVSFCKTHDFGEVYGLALGFDDGRIRLVAWNCACDMWTVLCERQIHHKTVQRLKFRPKLHPDESAVILASCGSDNSVKIMEIDEMAYHKSMISISGVRL